MRPQDIPARRETWRQCRARIKRETRAAVLARRRAILAGLDCGRVLTAAEIGAMAGVTSRSVWREVERLRALGYEIRGEAGTGYAGRVGRPSDA